MSALALLVEQVGSAPFHLSPTEAGLAAVTLLPRGQIFLRKGSEIISLTRP